MQLRLSRVTVGILAGTLLAVGILVGRTQAAPPTAAIGTAVPFQGFLQSNGVAVNGHRDMTFQLFDALSDGTAISPVVALSQVPVVNGFYAVPLDFGPAAWQSNEARWIQVSVQGDVLAPRTRVYPAPQALYAVEAANATTLATQPLATFSRLFGTGESGDLVKATPGTTNLSELVGSGTPSFANISITAGTLVVPSGTLLRCTGQFHLANGAAITIDRLSAEAPDQPPFDPLANSISQDRPVNPGIAGPATSGPPRGPHTTRPPGYGGTGLGAAAGAQLRDPGPTGGGAAPGSLTRSQQYLTPYTAATAGGGSLVVRCAGNVTIDGTVSATGANGSSASAGGGGGGGGGVVLVGSGTSITGSGGIDVRGGGGGDGTGVVAPGGGGGGGLVHLVAPAFGSTVPTTLVAGGIPGVSGGAVDDHTATRGGTGGGGSCGSGGNGAAITDEVTNLPGIPASGQAGCAFQTTGQPGGFW